MRNAWSRRKGAQSHHYLLKLTQATLGGLKNKQKASNWYKCIKNARNGLAKPANANEAYQLKASLTLFFNNFLIFHI